MHAPFMLLFSQGFVIMCMYGPHGARHCDPLGFWLHCRILDVVILRTVYTGLQTALPEYPHHYVMYELSEHESATDLILDAQQRC